MARKLVTLNTLPTTSSGVSSMQQLFTYGQQTPGAIPIVVGFQDRPICTGAPLTTPADQASTKKSKRWDEEMDSDLVKEMLNSNIFSYKYNSKSRGAQWKLLAERLNEYWGEGFQTNERALRDKYNGLKKKFKNKMRYEEAASGIAPPDLTELERGLEELIEKEEQDKNEDKIKSEKDEALSARDRCMKGMTPKRKGSEEEGYSKRVSKNDTITYLREKMEREDRWRREEAEIKEKQFMAELEVRKLESEERKLQAEAQTNMFKELCNMLARK